MELKDEIGLIDLRYRRALAATSAIMKEIHDIIPDKAMKDVHYRLFDLFHKNGLSIMPDEDRSKEGFEPRGATGWTPSERVAEKMRQFDVVMMMANISNDISRI
jgi:hypothetical protein